MIQLRKRTMQIVDCNLSRHFALLFGSVALLMVACGKTEEKPAEDIAVKEVVVDETSKETLNDMMKRLGIDKRVRVEDSDKAPNDVKQAEAVLLFFDAMVRGNAEKLSPLMSQLDQAVLANMNKSGQWKIATENISRVNVGWTSGAENGSLTVLGFYTVGDVFAAQLWSLSPTEGESPLLMTALASPPKIDEKLQGNKTESRIKQWMNMNKEEIASAKAPDEIIEIPQQDRSVKGESNSSSEPESTEPKNPSGPGRRKPTGAPVDAPGGPPLKPR